MKTAFPCWDNRIAPVFDTARQIYIAELEAGRMVREGQEPLAAGPNGHCVCPQCGQQEPHQRGVPCIERRCPNCGAAMIRQ